MLSACASGHTAVVEALGEAVCDDESRSDVRGAAPRSDRALTPCSRQSHGDTRLTPLHPGAQEGHSGLHLASQNGRLDTVTYLLEQEADLGAETAVRCRARALAHPVGTGGWVSLTARAPRGRTGGWVAPRAAPRERRRAPAILRDHHETAQEGDTCLHLAGARGHGAVAEALVRAGATLDAPVNAVSDAPVPSDAPAGPSDVPSPQCTTPPHSVPAPRRP